MAGLADGGAAAHLMSVAALVLGHGGGEDAAIGRADLASLSD